MKKNKKEAQYFKSHPKISNLGTTKMDVTNLLTGQPKFSLFHSASSNNDLIFEMNVFVVPFYIPRFSLSL